LISVAEYLDTVAPHIPAGLISPQYLGAIREVASCLPGAMAFRTFGFECALSDPAPDADFLISLGRSDGGPDILAGTLPGWQRIRTFGKQWADPASPLHDQVDDVWLEFDMRENRSKPPVPSLFFSPVARATPSDEGGRDIRAGHLRLIQTVWRSVVSDTVSDDSTGRWGLCIESLSSRGSLFQVGLMLPRPTRDIRLCMHFPSSGQLLDYLTAIGWPGPREALRPLVEELFQRVDDVALDIDVGASVSPKIGLECAFKRHRGIQRGPKWDHFLDFLVERGMCLPAKRDGLLAYPGYAHTDDETQSVFVRHLFHIKVVCQPGQPLTAKAYLSVAHRRSDAQAEEAAVWRDAPIGF